MKKQFFSLLAVCAFSAVTFANNSEETKNILETSKANQTEATTLTADDDFWICREVSTVVVRNRDLGITTVTTTYECSWWTLDGPGTPPAGNVPGPGNGLPGGGFTPTRP